MAVGRAQELGLLGTVDPEQDDEHLIELELEAGVGDCFARGDQREHREGIELAQVGHREVLLEVDRAEGPDLHRVRAGVEARDASDARAAFQRALEESLDVVPERVDRAEPGDHHTAHLEPPWGWTGIPRGACARPVPGRRAPGGTAGA